MLVVSAMGGTTGWHDSIIGELREAGREGRPRDSTCLSASGDEFVSRARLP
jgi:hypothetical protein